MRGRTISAGLVALLVLLTAHCIGAERGYFVFSGSAAQEAMDLTFRCKSDANWLYVEYTVHNNTASDLYSYDGAPGVPSDNPEWPDATQQVYISFRAPGAVQIKRMRAPIPPGQRLAQVRIPVVARVKPGAARVVRFRIHLPLSERSEYTPDFSGATYEERVVNTIEMWVGYFALDPRAQLAPLPDHPDLFQVHSQSANQLLAHCAVAHTVKVRVRTDPKFQRL